MAKAWAVLGVLAVAAAALGGHWFIVSDRDRQITRLDSRLGECLERSATCQANVATLDAGIARAAERAATARAEALERERRALESAHAAHTALERRIAEDRRDTPKDPEALNQWLQDLLQ